MDSIIIKGSRQNSNSYTKIQQDNPVVNNNSIYDSEYESKKCILTEIQNKIGVSAINMLANIKIKIKETDYEFLADLKVRQVYAQSVSHNQSLSSKISHDIPVVNNNSIYDSEYESKKCILTEILNIPTVLNLVIELRI